MHFCNMNYGHTPHVAVTRLSAGDGSLGLIRRAGVAGAALRAPPGGGADRVVGGAPEQPVQAGQPMRRHGGVW